MKDLPLFLHDLRAPLARAKTYGKLLLDAKQDDELVRELLRALEDLDARLREAEEKS